MTVLGNGAGLSAPRGTQWHLEPIESQSTPTRSKALNMGAGPALFGPEDDAQSGANYPRVAAGATPGAAITSATASMISWLS